MSQHLSCDKSLPATSDDSPIPGISEKTLNRFSALKKRRELQSSRSTAKRIRDMKSELGSKIQAEFSNPDELAALQRNNVELSSLCPKAKQLVHHADTTSSDSGNLGSVSCSSSSVVQPKQNTTELGWLEVKPYLGVNSHLSEDTGGSGAPKSGLELKIHETVALQEYDVAEQLSDRLATRDFGVQIADAIDAKRYLAKREHDAAMKKATKKKKLAWGFEPKHRWETKGNM